MIARLFEAVWERLRSWYESPIVPFAIAVCAAGEAAIVFALVTGRLP